MWDAKIGMQVVCIRPNKGNPVIQILTLNKIYTIRDIGEAWNGRKFLPAVQLLEVVNPITLKRVGPNERYECEGWYDLSRFVPLNKNFSVFKEILRTSNLWKIKEIV
jgi:hypothetical protein